MDEQRIARGVLGRASRQGQACPKQVAERIEAEIDRLRKKRPALADRIDRAANLLVTHLSCRRQGVIRVRVRQGCPRLLVSGSEGAVYVVDPADWSCTCPDFHRRGKGCKHGLAAYVLARASRPAPKPLPCAACGERFPRRVMVEVQESLTYHEGDLLCTPCWIDSDAEVL
ncbi:MAG: SWIM zinc finger domain-containing protein [Actinomycetota bacterium]|nr:SWIM zinc finger domain-containing protein [Actinomycetota bacterium]